MLDMILGVRDAWEWHDKNMQRNKGDYAWPLSWCSGSVSGWVQENGGSHVLYHPYIDVSTLTGTRQQLKYGVISIKRLEEDLAYWDTLFCAGRLHKPTAILKSTSELNHLLQQNHRSALYTALLLLPLQFTERHLYLEIAGLSYVGDIRFVVGAENRNKVTNIVDANLGAFQQLYRPLLEEVEWVQRVEKGDDTLVWEYKIAASREQLADAAESLPAHFRRVMAITSHQLADLVTSQRGSGGPPVIRESLSKIVRKGAITQQAKNFLTAGVGKSATYLKAKWQKGRQGPTRPFSSCARSFSSCARPFSSLSPAHRLLSLTRSIPRVY